VGALGLQKATGSGGEVVLALKAVRVPARDSTQRSLNCHVWAQALLAPLNHALFCFLPLPRRSRQGLV
jgi:hypothetical protein